MEIEQMDWNKFFMSIAYLVAMKSKDSKTRIGAVIVGNPDKEILSVGYNGLPRGVYDTIEKVTPNSPWPNILNST